MTTRWWAVLRVAGVCMLAACTGERAGGSAEAPLSGELFRAWSGGTRISLFVGLDPHGVRLWGIEGPGAQTPAGDAAADFLEDLVGDQTLTCVRPPSDRVPQERGQVVRLCRLPDGRDIAAALVAAGHADDMPEESGGHYAAAD